LAKVRIFSLAKQLGLRSEALITALSELGVEGATPATAIDEDTARAAAQLLAEQAEQARRAALASQQVAAEATPEPGKAGEVVTEEEEWEEEAEELVGPSPFYEAEDPLAELERQLAQLEAQAREEPEAQVTPLPELVARPTGPAPEDMVAVPPVVTVLGHVDHGKTTLLDTLRNTNVVEGEHGGITQHIGASEIEFQDRRIVFIDTPGHEAFTQMRARGAQVTDVAVLIVAADDGVMPQTVEAIGHAKAAGVPIVVAINKIDLPTANPDRVKQQLLEHELVPEEWGGDVVVCEISALTGQGLDELLEMILLVTDVQQLWGEPEAEFAGIVVEASMDPSQGPLATVLVRRGTLSVGDVVIGGTAYGRVRHLRDWRGKSVRSIECGRPVEVVGLNDVPEAGEVVTAAESPKAARQLAEERVSAARASTLTGGAGVRLRALYDELHGQERADLNIVLKADAWGSVQAMQSSLEALGNELEEINLSVVHSAVGEVTESDVTLAVASKAIIIGFNVGVSDSARRLANDENVEIRIYNVIYEALEDVRDAMYGLLKPVYEQQRIGTAEVLQLFRAGRLVVAGCRVAEGRLERGARIVVTRNGGEVFEGTLETLRHFERNVSRIEAPSECGVSTSEFHRWQEGDRIEAFIEVEVERRRTAAADTAGQ